MTRVLYLDHEGGWGGASRSLTYLLSCIDRDAFQPIVMFRRTGPIHERLESQGIEGIHEPGLINITARAASHPANLVLAAPYAVKAVNVARRIQKIEAEIIHFNYEGLAPLIMAQQAIGDNRLKILHVRVIHHSNPMLRLFMSLFYNKFDHIIFISENELDRFIYNGFDRSRSHSVLYNPVSLTTLSQSIHCPEEGPFIASFFGTLDALRAPDRLLEVASITAARGCPIEFRIYGRPPPYPRFATLRTKHEDIRDAIEQRGLGGTVRIMGHVTDPEVAMAASHVVIRPSRGGDPWGRDVIEGLSCGRPVIATGTYDGFIEHGVTGFLLPEWDPSAVAASLIDLMNNRDKLNRMAAAAKSRARQLFHPVKYSEAIASVYNHITGRVG